MKQRVKELVRVGLQFKTALLVWAVSVGTLLIFVLMLIPDQRKTLLENLESRAFAITSALQNITSGAVIIEDYSSVVAQCLQILNDDKSIEYLVVSRNDGFSLIHDSNGQWRTEILGNEWHPKHRESYHGIQSTPMFDKRVFHYSKPFDYSSIQWGWIHVGLSLNRYDSSVKRSNQKIIALTFLCIGLSFITSLYYAQRLVAPILGLQAVVKKVAQGELTTRTVIESKDEVGVLAHSFNSMTDALAMKDRILKSICFAAQEALCNSHWTDVTQDILATLGSASKVSRSYLFENHENQHGTTISSLKFEWTNQEFLIEPQPRLSVINWSTDGMASIWEELQRGTLVIKNMSNSNKKIRACFESRGIQSVLLIPVMTGNSCWGFLGFDECKYARTWTKAEQESLRAAANMLGAAIEKKKTEDALRKAKASAEAANEAKSQFLANMSHEVRNPITGLIGMLHLLERQPLNERCRNYTENALISAESLLNVVGDILDFSKIEAGKMELIEKTFSLRLTIECAIRTFENQAEEKGIGLVTQSAGLTHLNVVGDPHRLHQILVNLIGNAVKFTEKGQIEIHWETKEETDDTVLLSVHVHDSGIGISEEHQSEIFDAFTQADPTMTRTRTGTGLGLSICRQLCQLMGGEIGMRSVHQMGSTFWFQIPFKKSDLPSTFLPEQKRTRGLKVLVADENPANRRAIRVAIESQLGTTEEAIDSEDTIRKLQAASDRGVPFNAGILDRNLPGTNVFTLAKQIKNDPNLKRTNLILLDPRPTECERDELYQKGFASSVTKPIKNPNLQEAIAIANPSSIKQVTNHPTFKPCQKNVNALGKILLVEDNAINVQLTTELVTDLGFKCECASNGREAIRALEHGAFDLVLMDCQMPIMDGYEATQSIRKNEERSAKTDRAHSSIPIVALTAHAQKGDRNRCIRAGMNDYLSKPLRPERLEAMLRKWIPTMPHTPDASPRTEPLKAENTSPPGLDFPELLERCKGKEDLANRLLNRFFAQSKKDIQLLTDAIRSKDFSTLKTTAHRLKGAALNTSALAIADTAEQIEMVVEKKTLNGANSLILRLKQRLAGLEKQFMDPRSLDSS